MSDVESEHATLEIESARIEIRWKSGHTYVADLVPEDDRQLECKFSEHAELRDVTPPDSKYVMREFTGRKFVNVRLDGPARAAKWTAPEKAEPHVLD